ncbi:MAG: hypothetical protein R6X02_35360 [Enhygromyxa sp.]
MPGTRAGPHAKRAEDTLNFNPYQAPTSAYDGGYLNSGSAGVSDRTVAALRKTRPWVVFVAVISFVGAGFGLLGGLVLVTQSVGEGLVAIFGSVLVLLPGVAMIRYSQAINRLLHGGGVAELEQSMEAQASVWQIFGIYLLIYLVLVVLAVLGMLAAFSAFF